MDLKLGMNVNYYKKNKISLKIYDYVTNLMDDVIKYYHF